MQNEIKNWTAANIPQRSSGLAVITGSTEGVGYEDFDDLQSKSSYRYGICFSHHTCKTKSYAIIPDP